MLEPVISRELVSICGEDSTHLINYRTLPLITPSFKVIDVIFYK